MDNALRRVSIVDRNWRFVRSFGIDGQPTDFAWLANGDFVFGGTIPTARLIGYPLHVLGPDGAVKASLGEEGKGFVDRASLANHRQLQVEGTNGFFAMTVAEQLEVEWWSGTRLERRWVLDSPFFPDRTSAREKRPFQTLLSSFWIDRNRTLYLMIVLPRKNWREGFKVTRTEAGEELFEFVDREKVYETVIEVIDLAIGRVLARSHVSRALFSFLGGGLVARLDPTNENGPRFEVSRIRLAR